MRKLDRSATAATLQRMPLKPETRRIGAYWLSLWEGDALPCRRRFEPICVRDLLPGIMILEIKPAERVLARLSGTAINAAFGMDLTGKDLLALAPSAQRETRLARNSDLASGDTFAIVTRRGHYSNGQPWDSEEIRLPFRDVTEDGARLFLLHSTLRPVEPTVDLTRGLGPPLQWRTVALDGNRLAADEPPTC